MEHLLLALVVSSLSDVYRPIAYAGSMVNASSMQLVGDTLYVGGSDHHGVLIYNISTPSRFIMGAINGGTFIERREWTEEVRNVDVFVADSVAYCLSEYDNRPRFVIYDISKPEDPRLLGLVAVTGARVIVADSIAYVFPSVDPYTSSFYVYNVSDPAHPQGLATPSAEAMLDPVKVAVSGDRLFALNASSLYVYDISTPESPAHVGTFAFSAAARDMAVSGMTAHVGTDGGLLLIDVTDASSPVLVGETGGRVAGLCVAGTLAYVNADDELRVVDVSSSVAPAVLGKVAVGHPGACRKVVAKGTTVLLECGGYGFEAIDVGTPSQPALEADIYAPAETRGLDVADNTLYLTDELLGLLMYTEGTLGFAGRFVVPVAGARAYDVRVVGGTAYLLCSEGLWVLDVRTPSVAAVLGSLRTRPVAYVCSGCWDSDAAVTPVLEVADGMVYIGDAEELTVVDARTPSAPAVMGRLAGGALRRIVVRGQYVFVADFFLRTGGLRVVDVSDPRVPTTVHTTDPMDPVFGFDVAGATLYVLQANGAAPTLSTYDISNAAAPVALGSLATEGNPFIAVEGGVACVATFPRFVSFVDVTNPTAPVAMQQNFSMPAFDYQTWKVRTANGRAYISNKGLYMSALPTTTVPTPVPTAVPTCDITVLQKYGSGRCTFGKSGGGPDDGGYGWTAQGNMYTDSGCRGDFRIEETGESVTCNNPIGDYMECSLMTKVQGCAPTPVPTPVPAPVPTPAPTPLAMYAVGCFKTTTRFLTRRAYSDGANTPSRCAEWCGGAGYAYAGVEFGAECWCGDSVAGAVRTVGAECGMGCTGDKGSRCGGGWRTSLYRLGAPGRSEPAPSAVGCFDVEPSARALHKRVYKGAGNTVGECTSVCWWNGHRYAGLEDSDECWCGDRLPRKRTATGRCSLPCSGNSSEHCGNGYRTTVWAVDGLVWSPPAHTYEGCYADSPAGRALPTLAFWDDGCTVEGCVAACAARGHSVAGLEYRSQCWCGDAVPARRVAESGCRLPCKGNSSQVCGYAYKLSVYSVA